MKRWLSPLILGALLALSACHAQPKLSWDTENITGALPDLEFTLTDDQGNTVDAAHYANRIRLLYFGYTHCPDVCPTTLATIQAALGKIGGAAKAVRVLFVSVDPQRDTPRALKAYTSAFGPNFVGLSGTTDQLQKITKRYHTRYRYYAPDAQGDYVVQHSAAIFVFDRRGKARLIMEYQKGPAAMAHDIAQLVTDG